MTDEVTINVSAYANWPDITNVPDSIENIDELPIVERGAGNYVLALTDVSTLQSVTAAAAITVPPFSAVEFPTGTVIGFVALTAGAVSFLAGSGVTIKTEVGLILSAENACATLAKVAENTWLLTGSLKAA